MVVSRLSQNVKISIVELFCHIRNVPFEKIGDLQMTLDSLTVSTSNARTHYPCIEINMRLTQNSSRYVYFRPMSHVTQLKSHMQLDSSYI